MIYEVGDKVPLSPDSKWWREDSQHNPRDMVGLVRSVASKGKYCYVIWGNGIDNVYGDSDLKVLGNTGMTETEVEVWYE